MTCLIHDMCYYNLSINVILLQALKKASQAHNTANGVLSKVIAALNEVKNISTLLSKSLSFVD